MNRYIFNKKSYLALGSGSQSNDIMMELIGSYLGLVDTVYKHDNNTPSIRNNCEYTCSDKIYEEKQKIVSDKYNNIKCKKIPDINNLDNIQITETDKCTAYIATNGDTTICNIAPSDCIYRFTIGNIFPNIYDNKGYLMKENILCPMFCGDGSQYNRIYERDNKYYVVFGWGSGLAYEDMIPYFIVCVKYLNDVLLKYMDGMHEIIFMGHSAGMVAATMITQLIVILSIPELNQRLRNEIISYFEMDKKMDDFNNIKRVSSPTNENAYYRSDVFSHKSKDMIQNEIMDDFYLLTEYVKNNSEYIKNNIYVIGSGGKPIFNIFCPVEAYMSFYKHQPIQFINTIYHDNLRFIDSHPLSIKTSDKNIVYKNIPSYIILDDSYNLTDYDEYKQIYHITPDDKLDSEIHAFKNYRNKLYKTIKT